MSYSGTFPGSPPTPIHDISNRTLEVIPYAAEAMVSDGADFMLTQVRDHTPESHPPVGGVADWPYVPGGDGVHLKDEMHRTEVANHGTVFQADVGSDKDYAPFVEEGTGLYGPEHAKYLIEPHNPGGMLVFPWMGQVRHFGHVWHPGSEGHHMFLVGGTLTEESSEVWMARGQSYLEEALH